MKEPKYNFHVDNNYGTCVCTGLTARSTRAVSRRRREIDARATCSEQLGAQGASTDGPTRHPRGTSWGGAGGGRPTDAEDCDPAVVSHPSSTSHPTGHRRLCLGACLSYIHAQQRVHSSTLNSYKHTPRLCCRTTALATILSTTRTMLRRRLSAGALRQLHSQANAARSGPAVTPASKQARATITPGQSTTTQSKSLASGVLLGTQRNWKGENVATLKAELKRRNLSQQGNKWVHLVME